jgi:anti-sigma regulatory factor (Ser/Thr protein kinase)
MGGEPLIRLERELPANSEAARQARLAMGPLADHLGSRRFDDLRLLVTELVTNSLRHAHLGAGDVISLVAQVEPGALRVEVSNPGHGFETPAVPAGPDAREGWGLYLLGRIADRWGINGRPMTCVWFEMDIENP